MWFALPVASQCIVVPIPGARQGKHVHRGGGCKESRWRALSEPSAVPTGRGHVNFDQAEILCVGWDGGPECLCPSGVGVRGCEGIVTRSIHTGGGIIVLFIWTGRGLGACSLVFPSFPAHAEVPGAEVCICSGAVLNIHPV